VNTSKALENATAEEREEASRTLSQQILGKIKQFFTGVFGHSEGLRAVVT
jgi:hypothetical protein